MGQRDSTRVRNVEGLCARARVEEAIRLLVKEGWSINCKTVSETAPCSTAWLYSQPDIKERILQLRYQARGAEDVFSLVARVGWRGCAVPIRRPTNPAKTQSAPDRFSIGIMPITSPRVPPSPKPTSPNNAAVVLYAPNTRPRYLSDTPL